MLKRLPRSIAVYIRSRFAVLRAGMRGAADYTVTAHFHEVITPECFLQACRLLGLDPALVDPPVESAASLLAGGTPSVLAVSVAQLAQRLPHMKQAEPLIEAQLACIDPHKEGQRFLGLVLENAAAFHLRCVPAGLARRVVRGVFWCFLEYYWDDVAHSGVN